MTANDLLEKSWITKAQTWLEEAFTSRRRDAVPYHRRPGFRVGPV